MKTKRLAAAALVLALGSFRCAAAPSALDEVPAPLDMGGAIGFALGHNYAILQAREAVRLQEGVIVQVSSQRIPNVGAQDEWQRNAAAISQLSPPSNELWHFGGEIMARFFQEA